MVALIYIRPDNPSDAEGQPGEQRHPKHISSRLRHTGVQDLPYPAERLTWGGASGTGIAFEAERRLRRTASAESAR
jgi:hypothetical protein